MKKILAIDDQPDNLITLEAILKLSGFEYEIFTATSGKLGIEIAERELPDVILLDIIMPEMDGYEVCSYLKNQKLTSHIPVVMLTALKTDSRSHVKGLEMGADLFLTKPIEPLELIAQLKVVFRIKETEDKLRAEKESLNCLVKERTKELVQSEHKYRSLVDNMHEAIIVVVNGLIKYTNPFATKKTGYQPNEFLNKAFVDFIYTDDRKQVIENYQNRMMGKKVEDIDFRVTCKDKSFVWVAVKTKRILWNHEKADLYIVNDLTLQKNNELALIKAKEKAEESDRLKSAFLANMSHEIRTPMNGILGFSGLLKEPGLTGEQQQKYIGIIEKSGVRMLNIINNIVDISKIESGLMNLDLKETNINRQIEYVFTFFKEEAKDKNLELKLQGLLPKEEVIVNTDREKLYAVLINLVKNAIKYTNEGSIEIGYRKTTKEPIEIEFFVKDTGRGIQESRLIAVFERFIQADIEDREAIQGAGLGLAISKAYVEMLNGKIWVESEYDKGSTFYFTIPYNPTKVEQAVFKKNGTAVPNTQAILKILVAEDDEFSRMLLLKMLEGFNSEILIAKDGEEALEITKNNHDIDVILMDVKMPKMSGIEAVRQIRIDNNNIFIVAQTAHSTLEDKKRILEAGFNNYITKPLNKNKLIEVINGFQKKTSEAI